MNSEDALTAEQVETNDQQAAEEVARFLGGVLEGRTAEVRAGDREVHEYGVGDVGTEFWADAPWRLEPGRESIPFTFIVRDGEGARQKVELERIVVEEATGVREGPGDRGWREVHVFEEELGAITEKYWVYRPGGGAVTLPLSAFATAAPGQVIRLRVTFAGKRQRLVFGRRRFEARRPLRILIAAEPLPLRDNPQWYYGDTHYHSSYTNDVKEFGNPIAETREAGRHIGLDWVTITDHSVDIADNNPYWEDPQADSRWDELGNEAASASDDAFTVVRGEEVTLLGRPGRLDDTLHMLVYGMEFNEMIPGAFAKRSLLSGVTARLTGFDRAAYEHLFGPVYTLEAVLTGVNREGEVEPALKGRTVRAQKALAFAAHPTFPAQMAGGEWEIDDLNQPIQGMEAWNSRIRYRTGKQEEPFDHWEEGHGWEEGLNRKGIDLWDQMLRHKVALPDPRFVLLGGSDAHGSFNYSVGWWFDWDGIRADDNCLGKVRTAIFLPERAPDSPRRAPAMAEIVGAFAHGRCVATDGPVLNFQVAFNGRQALMGDVKTLDGDGTVDVTIQAASTAEFGPIDRVTVHYYFEGMNGTVGRDLRFSEALDEVIVSALPDAPGFIRLSAETSDGDDAFRCFTNPIWLRPGTAGRRRLRVRGTAW